MRALVGLFAAAVCTVAQPAPLFEFHSSFWTNLHMYLWEQARNKTPRDIKSESWQAALKYYRKEIVPKSELSEEMIAVSNKLWPASDSKPLTGLDPALLAVLKAAAPVYRKCCWAEHLKAERTWLKAFRSLLEKHGAGMRSKLERIYDTKWPQQPVWVDLVPQASALGAYTSVNPTHITMSTMAADYQGDAALEMMFHEASHGLVFKVSQALDREAQSRGLLFKRRNFWHAVLFYTAGELTRHELGGNYVQYAAKGLFERAWEGALPVMEKDWKPYMDQEIDLATAIKRMVDDYGVSAAK